MTGRDRSFAASHVFPDAGAVPSWRQVREAERAGLALLDVEQLRPHYALTLRRWIASLEANHAAAVAAAGEASYRVWRLYLAGAAARFEQGGIGVVQVLAGRGLPDPPLPLGRRWMDPEPVCI